MEDIHERIRSVDKDEDVSQQQLAIRSSQGMLYYSKTLLYSVEIIDRSDIVRFNYVRNQDFSAW
jgi:hypothetical protein